MLNVETILAVLDEKKKKAVLEFTIEQLNEHLKESGYHLVKKRQTKTETSPVKSVSEKETNDRKPIKVVVFGSEYESQNKACFAYNLSPATVKKRAKDENCSFGEAIENIVNERATLKNVNGTGKPIELTVGGSRI